MNEGQKLIPIHLDSAQVGLKKHVDQVTMQIAELDLRLEEFNQWANRGKGWINPGFIGNNYRDVFVDLLETGEFIIKDAGAENDTYKKVIHASNHETFRIIIHHDGNDLITLVNAERGTIR